MRKPYWLILMMLAGCSGSFPVPEQSDFILFSSPPGNVTLEDLIQDRQLTIAKCSGCHGLYLPSQYSDSAWKSILPVMNKKARLNNEESERIERFLLLYSTIRMKGFDTNSLHGE